MRRFLPLFFLLPQLILAADWFTLESLQFIPQSYYVGDRVELRIKVRGEGELPPEVLKEFPPFPWGEIQEARLLRHGEKREIRIVFTPFLTGTQTLPVLRFGKTSLEGQKVHVRSLVDEGRRSLAQARGPLLLPSTKLYIGLLLGILLVLPLLGAFLLLWVRPRLLRIAAWYREQRPYRRFKKDLKALSLQIPLMDARSFYIALLDLIRSFLSLRYGTDCFSRTTRELGGFFAEYLGDRPVGEDFLRLFLFGDRVKFGNQEASLERRSQDAALAAEAAEALMSRREESHADL